jgi:hypothetical protein
MRHIRAIVLLTTLIQLGAAAPALAWWDWLEQLSGPGPWQGVVFGARLVCIVAEDGQPTETRSLPVGLSESSFRLVTSRTMSGAARHSMSVCGFCGPTTSGSHPVSESA